jgi:hypothetical protein
MKLISKVNAVVLALIILCGCATAFADTFVSEAIKPTILQPAADDGPAAPEDAPKTDAQQPDDPAGAMIQTETEGAGVNVRAAADANAEIVGRLAHNAQVIVLGVEGNWTQVRAGDVTGYVYSKYLKADANDPAAQEPAAAGDADVAREVRIRTSLGDVVEPGETITMTSDLIGFDGTQVLIQWQQDTGNGWKDISGAHGLTYSYKASEETLGSKWRVAVSIVG